MPQEIKYDRSHPAGATPEARIASRLKNSGDAECKHRGRKQASGPTDDHEYPSARLAWRDQQGGE